jgi:hypothetical protein
MGFKLYKKETVKFQLTDSDGTHDFEMDVNRLTAKESMQFQLKSSRFQDMLKSDEPEVIADATMQSFQMQIDLLAEIVTDLRGIEGLSWPEGIEERRGILNASLDLLSAAVSAYSTHGKVPANSTPKEAKAAVKKKKTT